MDEITLMNWAINQGFAVFVAIWLIYEKTRSRKELMCIIKNNTKALTAFVTLIEKKGVRIPD